MYRKANVEVEPGVHVTCSSSQELAIRAGDQCIIECNRVLDFGKVIGLDEVEGDCPADMKAVRILRRATLQDQAKANENTIMGKIAMNTCREKVEKHKLKLELSRVRYSFDKTVLTVVFTAEERVDFRTMVQELSAELHAQIDMKQIGVRDQAGLIGGMGPCGRKMCCCQWLHQFESINVKMAKVQGISLNPNAISGMCGRLKCCLKYEYDNYRELDRIVPREGSGVVCPDGKGYVIDRNILGQSVRVRLEDERVIEYKASEVKLGMWASKEVERKSTDEDPGDEWTESGSAGEA